MALFAKRAAIRRNEEHFHGERATILGKVPQSLDCGTLQDGYFQEVRHTWRDKCGTHGGISAMHGTSSQSVPQRGVC